MRVATFYDLLGIPRFATLPEQHDPQTGAPLGHPEGLCADTDGNIFANTFEFGGQNYIYVFNPQGTLITATPTAPSVAPLGCTVTGDKLYVNDVASGSELEYSLPLTLQSVPQRYPVCGGPFGSTDPKSQFPQCYINANYVGPDHRIYISDNGNAAPPAFLGLPNDFIGRISVLDPSNGMVSPFIDNPPELRVAAGPYVPNGSVLPFSANGIAFSPDHSALYIANMSTNLIYEQKVVNCGNPFTGCEREGKLSVFSHDPHNLIQGPDNMDFDANGNLWVASGQKHHVVALDRHGNIVGFFGSFGGFDADGAPIGLLQPSGVIFSQGKIYVGNESSQNLVSAAQNINWPALKLFTIASIDADVLESGK